MIIQRIAFVESTGAQQTYPDSAVDPNRAYLYRVTAFNGSFTSPTSAYDLGTTVPFTNDPLPPANLVRAAHVTQLRTAVNAVRDLAFITPATFTDSITVGTTIKAIHITQLRDALAAARTALSLPTQIYTNTITASSLVMTADLTELRDGVK